MRHHDPAKEETSRGEKVQLHGTIRPSTPRYDLGEFNLGHDEKVDHAAPHLIIMAELPLPTLPTHTHTQIKNF